MISSSLLHSQMQSALMGSSSPGVTSPAMGGAGNFASLVESPSGGIEAMGNTISEGVQGFLNEGKKVEQGLNKAVMGYGGLEQAVLDVAEYAVKIEAFKNIVDTAVGSVKAITLNMQI
jgi:hypothetical protein